MQFDHFGIFVNDIWDAYAGLTAHVPIKNRSYPVSDGVWGAKVLLAYGMGDVCYELIERGIDGPINLIGGSIGQINHVAYRVSSLDSSLSMATGNGAQVLAGPLPALGGGSNRAAFVLTKFGIIMELIEETAVKREAA